MKKLTVPSLWWVMFLKGLMVGFFVIVSSSVLGEGGRPLLRPLLMRVVIMGFIPLRQAERWDKSHFMKEPDENFYVMRSVWLDYIVLRQDMSHGVFRVAYFIASKINPGNECMWWGMSKIAKEMGVSVATVTSAVDALRHAGLMVVTKARFGSHRYFMRMPYDPDGDAFAALKKKRKKTGGRTARVSKNEIK